jgi:hypothetical protein
LNPIFDALELLTTPSDPANRSKKQRKPSFFEISRDKHRTA